MSKKEFEKIKEIVKQHTPKYEYYTPDTPILNCYDKGNCNSKQGE